MKLFLVGGFLGSGKTTAIQKACYELISKEFTVAAILNDQGDQLVDSEFISKAGIYTREVTNGCYCCNYHEFEKSIRSLDDKFNPEIIFAESVGSCADLVATVANPLNKFRPDMTVVISVFTDCTLLWSLMNGDSCFLDEAVRYIYKKQLEEADILVVNKADLLLLAQLQQVVKNLETEYPGKIIICQNSTDENDIRIWIEVMTRFKESSAREALTIDYDTYAEGEAQLAWLDKNLIIRTSDNSAAAVCTALANNIFIKVKEAGFPIGHIKFLATDNNYQHKISFTTTSSDLQAFDVSHNTNEISLLINARVQAEPALLQQIVTHAENEIMEETGAIIIAEKMAAFQPGYPKPTYRMANLQ